MVKFKILHLLFFPNFDLNIVALGEREGEREREIIFIPGNRSQFAPHFTFNYVFSVFRGNEAEIP